MRWVVLGLVVLATEGAGALADDRLGQQTTALKAIKETADGICYTVQQEGKQKELSGELQGQVNGVISKIVGLGVEGSGKLQTQEYQGVVREQLAATINHSADCKKDVFDKLVAVMLPPLAPSPPADGDNLLRNGGFEEDFKYWGTGYYETDLYKGSLGIFWASRVGGPVEGMKIADVRAEIDTVVKKSGEKSLKIINNSPRDAHIYGSMSQRITGLQKNTNYVATFWIKAERSGRGTFEITTDLPWMKRKPIEAGTYDWTEFTQIFNTAGSNFIDFRILSEEPGTVWVDDIKLKRSFPTN